MGDNLAGLLHHDRVPRADILAPDLVLIMERGPADGRASEQDRPQVRDRGQGACSPDLKLNLFQHGVGLFRSKFISHGPTWRLAGQAHTRLLFE